MPIVMDNIKCNWKQIKRGARDIINNWDSNTFYQLGSDFSDILFNSSKPDN